MASEALRLLALLRHADSSFPSAGFAFSHGLETLLEEGHVASLEEMRGALEDYLFRRWVTCERVILAAAHRAGGDTARLVALDWELDAMTPARELREGSRRQGGALLGTHRRIETPGLEAFHAAIASGEAPGHLPVVQGLVWRQSGLGLGECEAAAAHQLIGGLTGAAIRLGRLGVLDAQRIRAGLDAGLAAILARAVPEDARPTCFCPAAEIAAMRHETQRTRLFAN